MSNFICPTCGFTNIDCGKAGYKTEREIELEKKLEIAVKAMELARDTTYSSTQDCPKCAFIDERLSEALAKIKEIK